MYNNLMGKIILRNYILIALFLFFPVFSFAGQKEYEEDISKGISSLDAGNYASAEEAFRSALREKPDDPKATLYLGITLNRKGEKEAASHLKKALLMNPADPVTNLELGIYYYNKSIYDEAKDYFENIQELVPGSNASKDAQKYLDGIKRQEEKPWRLDVFTGLQYDSNVVLAPKDAPMPGGITRKSDWRGLAYLRGRYVFTATEKFAASAGYSFYRSLHSRLSDFDIMQHAAQMEAVYLPSNKVKISGLYTFEYVYVGGDGHNYLHGIAPSITISEGNGFSTTLQYRYSYAHFINSEPFPTNSDRTGSNNLIGISQHIPIGRFVEARVGYSYDKDSTREDFWDYTGNKGFLGLNVSLPKNHTLLIHGEYYKKDYDGASPLSGYPREDKLSSLSVAFIKDFSKKISLIVLEQYTRNKSNISVLDYERTITSLLVSMRF
jgi:hypothetical protein